MQRSWLLFCRIPKEDNKTLKYNHKEKSMKVPFIICDESLLEKLLTWYTNPEKSSKSKKHKHTASGYSIFTLSSFDTR